MFFAPLVIARDNHWLARKIDFLVRVTRRVPEVPRFAHCRSTVRHHGGRVCRSTTRRCTQASITRPAAITTRGKSQVAPQAFRTERHYCGTSNRARGRCRAVCTRVQVFRNGSQCPREAGVKCPVACRRRPTTSEYLRCG